MVVADEDNAGAAVVHWMRLDSEARVHTTELAVCDLPFQAIGEWCIEFH